MTGRRRAGIALWGLLLAGGVVLAAWPVHVGALRLAGLPLAWWYGVGVAPLLGLAALAGGARGARAGAAALLCTPALGAALVAAAFAGGHRAPLLVLATVLATLAPPLGLCPAPPSGRLERAASALAAGLLALAALLVAARAAPLLGAPPAVGATALALLAAGAAWPGLEPRAPALAGLGALALGLALLTAALASAVGPLGAWRAVAARAALAFRDDSPWVAQGGRTVEPVAVTVVEPHRVTAAAPVTVRVTERDGDRRVVREWALAADQSVLLRPGDELHAPAGARLRFERGRRVPGAPPDGDAWAAPAPEDGPAALLGPLVALGGAVALAPREVPGPAGAAPAAVVLAVVAALWGLYGAHAGPELALGAPRFAALVGLPGALGPAGALAGALGALGAGALGLLHFRALAAAALGPTPAAGAPGARGAALRAGVGAGALAALAALAARLDADPWTVFALGGGVAALARLPAPGGARSRGVRRAASALGLLALGALTAAGAPGPPILGALAVAWAVGWVGRRLERAE